MSNYFFKRISNLPMTNKSSTSTTTTSTVTSALTDDELLAGALEFEQTDEFRHAEEEAKKAREPPKIHPFFTLTKSPVKNSTSESKDLLVATSKKRSATDDDNDVVQIDAPSVIRAPVKRLPQTKPDFDTFAPKNQTVSERTKALLDNGRKRRAQGEDFQMTQMLAREQLRCREKLMRKSKEDQPVPVRVEEKKAIVPVKRKANPTETSVAKKARPGPKNTFDKLVQEMTETMTHVTLSNTTTSNTTTISSSSTSSTDVALVPTSTSVSSIIPLQSIEKKKPKRKIYTYEDYLIHILKWPITLLDEIEIEPTALYKDFLGENAFPVPLLELYSSFEEYEEITLPWLFEETFEEMKRSVKMKDHKLFGTEFDAVLHQMRVSKSGLNEIKCQILYKRTAEQHQRREMFTEDDLVVVQLVGETNTKIFGLVRSGEKFTDRIRLHKSLLEHPDVKIQPPVWFCHEFNIRIFPNRLKIVDGTKLKIRAIASLTATLRRFKALASMRTCPLFEHLLSPSIDDEIFQLTKRNETFLEEKYFQAFNESQRNVISEAVSTVFDTKDDEQAKVYMCQGPPGTGKSQTITGIVRALLQPILNPTTTNEQSPTITSSVVPKKKPKILICCPSNGGCNEIVRRLIDVFGRKPTEETTDQKKTILPFKLIRCARGGGVSEDIENVSLDILAQKRLEEVLNSGGQNEAIERNLANKEKQKKQLIERIELEKKKQNESNNQQISEELKDLELNLKEITSSIVKLQQSCRKAIPETIRRQREREVKIELIQEADVCISTLNYVGNPIFDSFSPFEIYHQANPTDKTKAKAKSSLFNCLIIDEAGQCIEIDNFIPLRLGMNRVILVGDPEQLPATILSRRALEAGLNQSLFERLYRLFKYDLNNPIRMLNIQYRMHDEICRFPSMHIYRSKLKTDKGIHQKRKKFLLKPYAILDVNQGKEELDAHTQSYGNPMEADIIVCLVQFINERAKVPFNQIGIITPYSYQVKLIEQRLNQRNLHHHKIEMGTVDAFQGRQKDVILLSCVRAGQTTDGTTTTSIGFVGNRQRLNVSLTRAKYAMYIIGHMNSLTSNEDWNKLHTNAIERQTIFQLTSPNQFDWLIKSAPTIRPNEKPCD